MIRPDSFIGFLLFTVITIGSLHGQEPLNSEWRIGAWQPESPSIWPRPMARDTSQSLEISGYGTLQLQPGSNVARAMAEVRPLQVGLDGNWE